MQAEFYTADEVMKKLSLSRSAFYREVEAGEIPSVLEEGRKRGRRFPKVAIDALVRLSQVTNKPKLEFGSATKNDIWQGYENTLRIYGPDEIVSFQRLLEWRQINPDIFMTVREGHKRVGGFTVIPLAESVIHSIFEDKMKEQDIPDWAIKKWEDSQLSVYIPNISVEKTGKKRFDTYRGRFLVKNAIEYALSLNKQYDIKNWYAYAATPEGKKLLDDLGFKPVPGVKLAYMADDIAVSAEVVRSILRKLDDDDYEDLMPNHE